MNKQEWVFEDVPEIERYCYLANFRNAATNKHIGTEKRLKAYCLADACSEAIDIARRIKATVVRWEVYEIAYVRGAPKDSGYALGRGQDPAYLASIVHVLLVNDAGKVTAQDGARLMVGIWDEPNTAEKNARQAAEEVVNGETKLDLYDGESVRWEVVLFPGGRMIESGTRGIITTETG